MNKFFSQTGHLKRAIRDSFSDGLKSSIVRLCKIGMETTFKVLRDGQELMLKAMLSEKE